VSIVTNPVLEAKLQLCVKFWEDGLFHIKEFVMLKYSNARIKLSFI
jgi:hypothetical protein